MTGRLIGADDMAGDVVVRPFLGTAKANSDRHAAPVQRSAVVELMELLALRDAEISGHEALIAKAYVQGEVAGRAAAEDAFRADDQAALETLAAGIDAAQARLIEALGTFETLALAIAVEAIDKLTAHPDRYRTMLMDTIAARAAEVEGAAILSIRVSRSDFPNTRTLAALAASLGAAGTKVEVCDERDPGDCVITLSLGSLEFGLGHQWEALKARLATLAQCQAA